MNSHLKILTLILLLITSCSHNQPQESAFSGSSTSPDSNQSLEYDSQYVSNKISDGTGTKFSFEDINSYSFSETLYAAKLYLIETSEFSVYLNNWLTSLYYEENNASSPLSFEMDASVLRAYKSYEETSLSLNINFLYDCIYLDIKINNDSSMYFSSKVKNQEIVDFKEKIKEFAI